MADDAMIRASDADRDRAAAALREHLAAGRLTIEEFDERLDQAYTARTLGELDQVMADLPAVDLGHLPSASLDRSAARPLQAGPRSSRSIQAEQGRLNPAWRAAWGSWLAISLFLFTIWLLSGATGGLWFLWIALPFGVLLLGRWIAGVPARRVRQPDRPRHDHGHRDDL